jgi:Ankyrin repeats (3 copies)/Ankyrin repeat
MPSRTLPPRPSLVQLKLQAVELRREHREGRRAAASRVVAHHPRMRGESMESVLARPLTLADAQWTLAREYGFDDWAHLKRHVETTARVAAFQPHPRFDHALAGMDAGDLDRLRGLLAAEPALIHARTNLEPPFHYFTGATLLHHVAANPDRGRLSGELGPLPANIVEVARLLLDSGADVNASTLGPNSCTTIGLVITSKAASDAAASGPLMDLLLQRGAVLDMETPGALHVPLANHAPGAAEKMIELGARPDLCAAAALGRMDLLRDSFDRDGRLLSRSRRAGKWLAGRDAIGLAMLFAYVNKRRDAVDFLLEKDGNWNMIGVNNGTAMHRAAWEGDLAMVQRLVARGADISNRNNPFTATPFSWADHNKQAEVCRWMREHCAIDLHDAVCFDLRDHVEARLREDTASVNRRIDQWSIPQGTPLHWAATLNREGLARLLLENGADPNLLAGNGLTALEMAEGARASGIATLLEERGGKRSADL